MIKELVNKRFWNVVWRFTGGNIILVCLGIVLILQQKPTTNIIISNLIIVLVFIGNCYKRKKKRMVLMPATIYFVSLCISYIMLCDNSLPNNTIVGFLQCLICLMWVFKFATPQLDVFNKNQID